MRPSSPLTHLSVITLPLLLACSSAEDAGANKSGQATEKNNTQGAVSTSWFFENIEPVGQAQLSRIIDLDGGVLVTTYPEGYQLLAFFVSDEGDVEWAYKYPGASLPTDIMKVGDLVRVVFDSGIVDLDPTDGSVERAVTIENGPEMRGTMTANGDMVLTGSRLTMRLNSDLEIIWAHDLSGGDVIEVDESLYVSWGMGLNKLSDEGTVLWRSDAEGVNGESTPIGLREMPDGSIFVGFAVNDLAAPAAAAWGASHSASGSEAIWVARKSRAVAQRLPLLGNTARAQAS